MTDERWVGALVVAVLHAAAFYILFTYRPLSLPEKLSTVFVEFISPPKTEFPRVEPPKIRPVRMQPVDPPVSPPLLTVAPATAPTEQVVPVTSMPLQPVPVADAKQPVALPVPLKLASELAVSCPERRAPVYPMVSRRMGDTGVVVLSVELNESGVVAAARVEKSSGHVLLDDAALNAVKTWKCKTPMRDGQAVRALAFQPFNFTLEGR